MDKTIWKSTGKWPYFLSNILVGVRVVIFLPDYPLVLSLLKHVLGYFWTKKMKVPNKGSPLNSSIDETYIL